MSYLSPQPEQSDEYEILTLTNLTNLTPGVGNVVIKKSGQYTFENFDLDALLSGYYTSSEVDSLIAIENLFDRTATTLSPHFSGDSLDMGTGNVTANDFIIPSARLGSSTYYTQNDFNNSFGGCGRKTGGVISDATGGYVAVSLGTGFIKATDDDNAQLKFFNWSAPANIQIPAGSTRYIGVEYNTGNPQVVARTTYNWNLDSEFPLGMVISENINGAEELYIYNVPWWITDGNTNLMEVARSLGLVRRDEAQGGLILSQTGTRNIAVSAGTVWSGITEFNFSGINTAVSGTFEQYWYKAGTGWQSSDVSQYSVTQWNDVTQTTLQTISVGKYCNIWIYGESNAGVVYPAIIMPQAEYNTPAQAEATKAPSNLPSHISNAGILLGRIIIKQGVDAPIAVQSSFTTMFSASVVTDHGNLAGLADDDHTQYWISGTARTGNFSTSGTLGAGETTLTGTLHPRAGTTVAGTSPIKFTSGDLLTVVEAGTIEYYSNTFYIRGGDNLDVNTGQLIFRDTNSGRQVGSIYGSYNSGFDKFTLKATDAEVAQYGRNMYILASNGGAANFTGGFAYYGGSGGLFEFYGGFGGECKGVNSGNNTGGDAGYFQMVGGQGGQARNSTAQNKGGNGGAYFIYGGPAGSAAGGVTAIGGNGGTLTLKGGDGASGSGASSTNTNGNGGNLILYPGIAGSSGTGGTPGILYLRDSAANNLIQIGSTANTLGFFNAAPVAKQGATTDLGVALSNLGLRTAGTAYPITTSGTKTFADLTSSKVVFTNASQQLTSTGIGTSSQFIKGDGSLDSSTYLTSVTAHNLLSTTHGDTLADTVFRGDIIIGNSTPKWSRLAFPASPTGKVLIATATDVAWSTNPLGTAAYAATGDFLAAGATAVDSDKWDGYQFSDHLDQAVKTTSSPTFANVTVTSIKDATYTLTPTEISSTGLFATFYFEGLATKRAIRAPFAFDWSDVLIHTGGQNETISVDIWTDVDANFPPTYADSIFANEYTGTVDATVSNKLQDDQANFQASVVDMVVFNTTDGTFARVTARDSATVLSLSANIMASGETYLIKKLPTLVAGSKGTAITSFLAGKGSVAKGDFVFFNIALGSTTSTTTVSCNINKT